MFAIPHIPTLRPDSTKELPIADDWSREASAFYDENRFALNASRVPPSLHRLSILVYKFCIIVFARMPLRLYPFAQGGCADLPCSPYHSFRRLFKCSGKRSGSGEAERGTGRLSADIWLLGMSFVDSSLAVFKRSRICFWSIPLTGSSACTNNYQSVFGVSCVPFQPMRVLVPLVLWVILYAKTFFISDQSSQKYLVTHYSLF